MLDFTSKEKRECQICGDGNPRLVIMGYIYKGKSVNLICEKCTKKYASELGSMVSCSCDRKIGETNCNHGYEKYDRFKDMENINDVFREFDNK